jgi:hypothetical protein
MEKTRHKRDLRKEQGGKGGLLERGAHEQRDNKSLYIFIIPGVWGPGVYGLINRAKSK